MTEPTQFDERYLKGIEYFNEFEFFEAHEVWEDLWQDFHGQGRTFYQGLIQVAVCLHHFVNGNIRGARKLYNSSTKYLSEYGDLYEGLDLVKFIGDLTTCCQEILDSTEEYPKIEINADLIPEIHLS